ncbi:MAG: hypothetical protein HQ559_01735 [Lentisphaerae bacterium]|nr:hypothetical protein [Lentisphaerota bacterium]
MGGDTTGTLDVGPAFNVGDLPPDPHDYLGWHAWARVQFNGGLRQRQCHGCGRWYFPQETHKHKRKGV